VIDHDDIDGASFGLQFQTELFLQRGEDRRLVRRLILSAIGKPLDIHVERPLEPRAVDDGAVDVVAEKDGQRREGVPLELACLAMERQRYIIAMMNRRSTVTALNRPPG